MPPPYPGRPRRSRRPLIAVAALALAAPLVAASAQSAGDVAPQQGAPRPAGAAEVAPPVTFSGARRRGQPVAVLTRATALRASPGGARVATLRRHTEFGTPRVLAAVGERGAWLRVMASELPNGATGWIRASAAAIVPSPWAVRADLSRRQVTVLRHGRVVRRFSVAIGRVTTPTPTGRFAVTDKLTFDGGSRAYGCCALALTGHQPHVEPGWRGGTRLAIHGTSSPGTIGTVASFGCLRATDADVRWLVGHVYLGSIVEVRP